MMTWQEIARFSSPIEAEIARGFLEAQGVTVRLVQEGAARVMGIYVGPFGEISLLVPEDQKEHARSLLEALERGEYQAALPPWLPDEPNGDEPEGSDDEEE